LASITVACGINMKPQELFCDLVFRATEVNRNPDWDIDDPEYTFDKKLFMELVVEECLNTIFWSDMLSEDDVAIVEHKIKEKFGIK